MNDIKSDLSIYYDFLINGSNYNIEQLRQVMVVIDKYANNDEMKTVMFQIKQNKDDPEKVTRIVEGVSKQKEEEKESQKSEEELISTVYGIDVSQIQHKKLSDDCEVFMFYSDKLQRNVIIENSNREKNLMEQLKKELEDSKDFQTEDNTYNANSLIEQKRENEDIELSMIAPKDVYNYQASIDRLSPEKRDKLSFLVMNAEALHIDTINIEHAFGVTERAYGNNIIEAYYDYEDKRYKVEQPTGYSYDNDIQDNIESTTNENDELVEEETLDTNDEVDIEVRKIEETPDLKGRVEFYRDNPEAMEYLSDTDKQYYQNLVDKYSKHLEKKEKEKSDVKVLTKKLEPSTQSSSGHADIIMVICAIVFSGGIIASVLIQLLNR